MSEEYRKTMELIRRLEKAFPKAELISIKKSFNKHEHNNTINTSYSVYVSDLPYGLDIGCISETEKYIDALIKEQGA